MKAEKLLSGLLSLLLLMNAGCTDDRDVILPTYEGNAKLKRTLMYSSVDDMNPIAIIDEYEYDSQDRISKVSSPMYDNGSIVGVIEYDLYAYNSSGQLTSISNFNANINAPSGFINLRNYIYDYSPGGEKERQYIEYPQINSFEYTLYSYSGSNLVRAETYNNRDELENFITYEYRGNRLATETLHSSNGEAIRITSHTYLNGLNTKTDVYGGSKKEKIREIGKTYDSNYNLIMLESKELVLWSSASSYVMRYEYY